MKLIYQLTIMVGLGMYAITMCMDEKENSEENRPPKRSPLAISQKNRAPSLKTSKKVDTIIEFENSATMASPEDILHVHTFNTDSHPDSHIHKQIKKGLERLQSNDPDKHAQMMQALAEYSHKHGGDVSAENVSRVRMQKKSQSSSSSKESPHKPSEVSKDSPKQGNTTEREAIRDLKAEMRKLTLHAAEDAATNESKRADRNMWIGVISASSVGLLSAIITAVGTYLGGNCGNKS
jgi:hypothetical protein